MVKGELTKESKNLSSSFKMNRIVSIGIIVIVIGTIIGIAL